MLLPPGDRWMEPMQLSAGSGVAETKNTYPETGVGAGPDPD